MRKVNNLETPEIVETTSPKNLSETALIPSLLSLSKSGIFFIENPKRKTIDIRIGTDMARSLQWIIKEAVQGFLVPKILQRDILSNRVQVGVLEYIEDRFNLNLKYAYWIEYYKNLGYSFYRQNKNSPVKYKIKKEYIIQEGDNFTYHAVVCLCHSKTKVIVGAFNTDQEADEFINLNYKDGIVNFVYADNELTKLYNTIKKEKLNSPIKLRKV